MRKRVLSVFAMKSFTSTYQFRFFFKYLLHDFSSFTIIFVVLLNILNARAADALQVVPLSMNETVRQADAIVVGTITGHQSRWGDASHHWMQTDYTLAVEDVVYPSEQGVTIRQTIVLTYWGGTIGGETQTVADVRLPVDGERLVMMLHSRWAQGGTIAPTVGLDHGLFSVVRDAASGKLVVRDAAGQPLALTSDGQMARGNVTAAVADGATAMDLPTFTGWLRANINSIKTAPSTLKPTADQNDPRVMKIFAKSPELAGLIAPDSTRVSATATSSDPAVEVCGGGVPAAGPATETKPSLATSVTATITLRTDGTPARAAYSTSHQAHPPIVVNQFPTSWTTWSPEDQYQMSKWNYYASNIFRVYTTPTGTYGWNNGRFDLAGWPSEADLKSVYGSSWYCGSGCTTLGVTFSKYDSGGWIVEADIALNPAASWTLDDEWVFNGSSAISFRQTMIHELGHMHGLNHNFSFLALMNYLNPGNYRAFSFPYADDAQGIRIEYPSNAVSLTDLAVYLYYENGTCYDGTTFYNCVSEATHPSSVAAGGSLAVNNYHVENVGTTTISTPTIEWYLTAARTFSSSYYYLGQSTYSSLSPFTYFTPSTVGRTLTVPASVPAGNYYLAAYIRDDAGTSQSSFPFSNNKAFSLNVISVTNAPPSCTYTISTASQTFTSAGGTGSVTVTASASSCTWTATESLDWVSITSGASGTGKGTVSYSVSDNTSTSSRTGNIAIAGQTFTITQAGATTTCTYTISPEKKTFTSKGGTGSVTVTASSSSSCSWTASEALSWVSVTSGSSGTGSGTVTYSVSANTSKSTRTGNMTIAGKTFIITQKGKR